MQKVAGPVFRTRVIYPKYFHMEMYCLMTVEDGKIAVNLYLSGITKKAFRPCCGAMNAMAGRCLHWIFRKLSGLLFLQVDLMFSREFLVKTGKHH